MSDANQVKAALMREFVPLAIIVAVAAGLQRLTHHLFSHGTN
jgi:hypothetical protein